MKVSIAACTYNGSRFLREQLSSFAAQSVAPHELVICDDGSTDGSLEMARSFATTAPFPVHVFVNPNRLGVTANFSTAIGLCSGDLIALSDQDDIWSPPKLQRIVDAFQSQPDVALAFSDADAVDDAGRSLGYRLWDAVLFTAAERRAARRGRLLEVLMRHQVVTGATLAFPARFRDLLLPIPEHCLHDQWIAVLLAAVGRGYALEEPLIRYRQHSTQTSGGERPLSLLDQARMSRRQTPEVLRHSAEQIAAMRERLVTANGTTTAADALERFDAKISHIRARARIRGTARCRLPHVLRELMTRRYFRYSYGWRAVLADLFL